MLTALLLAQALATGSPAAPPQDWATLPTFPAEITMPVEAVAYVRAQVRDGHCTRTPATTRTLAVPVAILVGPGGTVRQITPQAIDCPSVEQYTVGLLLSATRRSAGAPTPPSPGWYALTPIYRW